MPKNYLLITEGIHDKKLLIEIFKKNYLELPLNYLRILPEKDEDGGDTWALNNFKAAFYSSDQFDSIGLILDINNKGVESRYKSFMSHGPDKSFKFPKAHKTTGTIIQSSESKQRIGLWLMPDNQNSGNIENFMLCGLKQEIKQEVENCLDLLLKVNVAQFQPKYRSKAILSMFLAVQANPGEPPWTAFNMNYFEECETMKQFIAWCKELFPV
jgi:hypothetical protein